MDMDFRILEQLTQIFGPSGSEEQVAEFISAQISPYCDEVISDTLGNLLAVRHGTGKKIMVAAHMDEIGLMITHIDKEGFLRFTPLGGVRTANLVGQRVKFNTGRIGTIGVEKLAKPSDFKLDKLYIDIGAVSQNEAEQIVHLGETAVFVGDFVEVGSRIMAKALDDRVGCFVVIEALKRSKSTNELVFAFTAQEEIGTRGAKTAAYALEPDLAIAVDVTATGDTPKDHTMSVKLGSGVGIKVLDRSLITPPQIKRWMAGVAAERNIPFQWEVLEYGGTDSGAIHLSRGGVPSGVISIPTRYVHSPAEMVDRSDVQAAVDLLVSLLEHPPD
ncbi:M42 family metallopeptidase [Desulfosporosinus meridiei]|uniref:Peptidase family protein n=1 Tax=Desulfosporosinus meridiei (strain ATCC BAA-275 / DSM 13257 / KCTC 12902 / NCIMB 13706 / S10) TaxID=768704 RepID=J7J381_DESMD|nr:M42 family metallopeptidase [Desulfosporosinus meridiei]AFQ45426.1 peptidase family protein [Desulfosporosinus meridiei DSM 13257]